MKPTLAATTYLTSKWLVLIRPLLAGFHRPLTMEGFPLPEYQQLVK
jgi:hypothetical protein